MTIPGDAKPKPGGKIAVTASGGGLFPIPPIPQYTASKHALVGLVRALGGGAADRANIRINAICPAIVDTAALPTGLIDRLPGGQVTPMSTILRCFDAVADFGGVGKEDWVEQRCTGETVEGNVDNLIWHHPPTRPVVEGGFDRKKGIMLVAQAYEDKKRRAVAEDNKAL